MKLRLAAALTAGAIAIAAPAMVSAHFILMEPKSWLVENNLGDPQKMGPCGGTSANAGTPTGAMNTAVGGTTVHFKVQETIYHPGFYRVALAVKDRKELPADPEAVTKPGARGPMSVSGHMDFYAKPPVLADGIFEHHEKPAGPRPIYEADIKIPNINCDHCTLQIIQFMEEHGENPDGRFTYHHCADVKITADPKLPIDTRWPGQVAVKKK